MALSCPVIVARAAFSDDSSVSSPAVEKGSAAMNGERTMSYESMVSANATGNPAKGVLGNDAAARSREAAEELWMAVCRAIRGGHQQRPAFVLPGRGA